MKNFPQSLLIDQAALHALRQKAQRPTANDADKQAFATRLAAATAKFNSRMEQALHLEFADDLPINSHRETITQLLDKHPVLIVCGETGSGKTTQLPKICLAAGRGRHGLIGHTQPRRLAARTVARRLADELQTTVGSGVALKTRFQQQGDHNAWIKLMTDGVLLAEIQSQRDLLHYDTIIIDEAHERSLNIDFLLGYLKQLLHKRRDNLRLIITSATIAAEQLSQFFAHAPIVEVSGRLYPVDIGYRPWRSDDNDGDNDMYTAIAEAVDELSGHGPGDILVFLPGTREIREASELLKGQLPPSTELIPLMSRLANTEQDRIFAEHHQRRVILATNVAETSITVPGIRYVVDSGLARIKRYSYRQKIEQLPIEAISQAAAKQRAGRCGRVADGICLRLYDEEDLLARPLYNDPEILRSSLAGVILKMMALGLGAIERFPFLDAPPAKAISDGYALLHELAAIDGNRNITDIGHILAKIPLDPRLARMLYAASSSNCLAEMLVIVTGLSIADPRERPLDKQAAADQAHQRFADPRSEFLSYLKLWLWLEQNSATMSQRQFSQLCRTNYLSPQRVREWRDMVKQLSGQIKEWGWQLNSLSSDPASASAAASAAQANEFDSLYVPLHRALLGGLLGNIGMKADDGLFYLGARALKFLIHPGSTLAKKAGKWIVAAELMETSRLYARCIAKVEPEWIEEIGAHLIKRTYSEPHWEKAKMQVAAWERVTLYGVPIVMKRRIHYGPHSPSDARQIFIEEALVGGEIAAQYHAKWAFFRHNVALIEEIELLEHKQRRQDVLVDTALIAAFYDARLPDDGSIINAVSFDQWRMQAERQQPRLLYLNKSDLMRHEAAGITSDAFPPQWLEGQQRYPLTYFFSPGEKNDGVSLTLPITALNQINDKACEWLVPGLIHAKILHLLKSLPQKCRAPLVPLPQFASDFIATVDMAQRRQRLLPTLIHYIAKVKRYTLQESDFRSEALPDYLLMNFILLDVDQRFLGQSRHIAELRQTWGNLAQASVNHQQIIPESCLAVRDWTFGEWSSLPQRLAQADQFVGFPAIALNKDGASVSLVILDTEAEATKCHLSGLTALFAFQFTDLLKQCSKNIPNELAMLTFSLQQMNQAQLAECLTTLTIRQSCLATPLPHDAASFKTRCSAAKPRINLIYQSYVHLLDEIYRLWQNVQRQLAAVKSHKAAHAAITAHVQRLCPADFLLSTPMEQLPQLPRYLKAITSRINKLKNDPTRDSRLQADYLTVLTPWERHGKQLSAEQQQQFRWLLEELAVGLFAQELKTTSPVSVKRLSKIWQSMNGQ